MNRLNIIAQAIYDKKGSNIIALDVREFSNLTDYYIIAEGNIERHVKAICRFLIEQLGEHCIKPSHVEGESAGDWVVLDLGDVIVHLLSPESREKYGLELLWTKAKIVNLEIKLSQEDYE